MKRLILIALLMASSAWAEFPTFWVTRTVSDGWPDTDPNADDLVDHWPGETTNALGYSLAARGTNDMIPVPSAGTGPQQQPGVTNAEGVVKLYYDYDNLGGTYFRGEYTNSMSYTSVTVCVWLNADTFPGSTIPVLWIINEDSLKTRMSVRITSADDAFLYVYDDDNDWLRFGPNVDPGLDVWYHLAFTFNAATDAGSVYLNGLTQSMTTGSSGTFDGMSLTNTFTTYLGRVRVGAANTFNGFIDDVRVYDRVLTSSEVWNVYYNTPPIANFSNALATGNQEVLP